MNNNTLDPAFQPFPNSAYQCREAVAASGGSKPKSMQGSMSGHELPAGPHSMS
jgi:hypothetical protein